MKYKVMFVTNIRITHIATAFKARDPAPASHINGEIMNTQTKPKKEPNLASIKREEEQLQALSLCRASKPPHISAEQRIPRG
jgi:hypothetical protein